ncbi:glycoside hydrolase family 116 protein [Streptosporangium sp. KLBMP 9127]|nr:glycoside hydrolase family 116 protein [Streptosporangium sp. KLBMP 9127]
MFERGSAEYDRLLWNGEYYAPETPPPPYGRPCRTAAASGRPRSPGGRRSSR